MTSTLESTANELTATVGQGGAGGHAGHSGNGRLRHRFGRGSVRYNTGSHVDLESVSLMTGISRGTELSPGRLTLGAFFEYGNGSYDTHNSFADAPSVTGGGNLRYFGGGVLGRMDFNGAAYEHEFDGQAWATTNGRQIDTPEVKSGSGIGEIGLSFKAPAQGFEGSVLPRQRPRWPVATLGRLALRDKAAAKRRDGNTVRATFKTASGVEKDSIADAFKAT